MHTFVSVASGTIWSEYNAESIIHASVIKSRIVYIKDYGFLKPSFRIILKFINAYSLWVKIKL